MHIYKPFYVIPAEAGIQDISQSWIPDQVGNDDKKALFTKLGSSYLTFYTNVLSLTYMNLEQEIKTFEENKENLLAEKRDRFVLIKGKEVVSDFASFEDALSDGYKRYGNEEFLVKQVIDPEPVNFFTREVVL